MSASDWELLEYDAELNRALFGRPAVQNGVTGMDLKVEYYVDPVIEANKTELNNQASGWKGDYHKVASLSPAIAYGEGYIAQALKEGDERAMSKWFNDSDNRAWRTKEGRI